MDEDKLMQRIDQENFNLDHLVEEFPDTLTSDYLLTCKSLLERRLNVVTRKLSELILSRQPTYVDELQRIADLQKSITESIRVCTQGRSCLRFIKNGAAKNGSIIVEHHRKRESLAKLLDSLTAISDLRRSVFEIRDIIDIDEDFPRAIQMCGDVKAMLVSFENYKCVDGLGLKLNDTLEFINEQMDSMLSKLCLSYSPGTYAKLQQSYIMMDRNINAQALKFFRAYHKSSMDELKMFLENELWEVVPVKSDFKLVQLKEFSFLRTVISRQQPVNLTKCQHQISHYNYTNESLVFEEDEEFGDKDELEFNTTKQLESVIAQFDRANQDTEEDLLGGKKRLDSTLPLDKISLSSESDENLDSELNKDFVEEDEFISSEEEEEVNRESAFTATSAQQANKQSSVIPPVHPASRYSLTRTIGPALTNSSLNVLRLFGKYIQMMSVLEPISYEILMGIYNLLDQYTMVVYKKFGPETNDKKSSDDKNISPKLKIVIRSIRESLIGSGQSSSIPQEDSGLQVQIGGSETSTTATATSTTTNLTVHQGVPNITSIINQDLATIPNRGGDEPVNPKKAVAVESLIFLVNQLWNLQEYLESLIPADLRPQLREQFSQNHSNVPDFLKARAELNTNIQYNNKPPSTDTVSQS